MTTKRKLWFSMAALALTLVVAATSVGITLSALSANVNSGFSISYTATSVNCAIYGDYTTGSTTKRMTNGESDHIYFTGSKEENPEQNFDPIGELTLTEDSPTAKFDYNIFNFANKPLNVTAKLTGEYENLDIKYTTKTISSSPSTQNGTEMPFSTAVPFCLYSNLDELTSAVSFVKIPTFSNVIAKNALEMSAFMMSYKTGAQEALNTLGTYGDSSASPYTQEELTYFAGTCFCYWVLYQYYLGNGEEVIKNAKQTLDSITTPSVFKNKVDFSNNFLYYKDYLLYFDLDYPLNTSSHTPTDRYNTPLMAILSDAVNSDNPVLDFVDYLDYAHFLATNYWIEEMIPLPTQVLIYNIYNTFIEKGTQQGITLAENVANRLKEFSWMLVEGFGYTAEKYYPIFLALPDELRQYSTQANGTALAEAKRKEYYNQIYSQENDAFLQEITKYAKQQRALILECLNDKTGKSGINLILADEFIPRTQIEITISVKDTSQPARLTNGGINFSLS